MSGATLDASTPPLAHTKPCRVRVIRTPRSMRTTAAASRRTTSTCRGSRSHRSPNARASGRGVTVRRSTTAPSALETIFWVTTSTSPARGARSGSAAISSRQPVAMRAARSSPWRISGSAGSATASRRCTAGTGALRRRRRRPRRGPRAPPAVAGSSRTRSAGVSRSKPTTGSTTSWTVAWASRAARRWASRLPGPKCGSMMSGGLSSRAFVPSRASAAAITASGGARAGRHGRIGRVEQAVEGRAHRASAGPPAG